MSPSRNSLNSFWKWQVHCLEQGAEFVETATYLVWLKSKMLLPKQEQKMKNFKKKIPILKIIHHLLDYCRFKQAANELAIQEQQQACYFRRTHTSEWKKPLGA